MIFEKIVVVVLALVVSALAKNPCVDQPNGKLFPYERSPVSYLFCMDGEPLLMSCEDGLEFDVEKNECKIKSSDLGKDVTNNESEQKKEIEKAKKDAEEQKKQQMLRESMYCKNLRDGTTLAYSLSCNEYYVCENGVAKLTRCPDQMYFNSKIGECMEELNSECSLNLPGVICVGKKNGELVPYPDDCGKFVVCVLEDALEKHCPPGLHFSPTNHVCSWPDDARCEILDICQGKENSLHLPHKSNCSNYYVCFRDETYLKMCPNGLHYSESEEFCMSPELAGCDPTISTTTLATTTTTSETTVQPPLNMCKDKRNGEVFAKPENCTEYYICFRDETVSTYCNNNLHFSPTLKYCVAPELAGCDPSYTTTTSSPNVTTLEPPLNICDKQENGTTFPQSQNCSEFILCVNNTALTKTCSSDLHYSASKNYCMRPELAECDPAFTTTTSSTTNGTTHPTHSPSDMCKGQKDRQTFPQPSNCSEFYICANEKAVLDSCVPGLHFSPTQKYCLSPKAAGCDPDYESTTSSSNTNAALCKGQKDEVLLPNKKNCGEFYRCENEKAILELCASGLHFSPTQKYCISPKAAGCDLAYGKTTFTPATRPSTKESSISKFPSEMCNGHEDRYLLPNPQNCGEFYMCVNGVARLESCAEGLHYSPTQKYCISPKAAGCDPKYGETTKPSIKESSITKSPSKICSGHSDKFLLPHPQNCNEFYTCENGEARLESCSDGLHFSPIQKYCISPEAADCHKSSDFTPMSSAVTSSSVSIGDVCTNQPSGKRVKHPNDCKKFVVCINDGVVMDCPPTTEFNAELQVCDWPQRANCSV